MSKMAMHHELEISAEQMKAGQVKDAKTALQELRAKYELEKSKPDHQQEGNPAGHKQRRR